MDSRNTAHNPGDVRRFYHNLAGRYDTLDAWGKRLFFGKGYLALDRAIEAHLPPDGHILDLGCGTGLNVARLLALELPFRSYIGVDFSEDMLAKAGAKFEHLENIRFKQLDLSREILPEGPFDLIVSTWVFEHLADPSDVVEKAWQRLVPGGHIVLLFMVKRGWVNLCATPILKLSNAQLSYGAEGNVHRHFPGMVSLEHFVGGAAVLTVLHKPEMT